LKILAKAQVWASYSFMLLQAVIQPALFYEKQKSLLSIMAETSSKESDFLGV